MKLRVFDRKKYAEAINALIKRNAPTYIIEAYKQGYVKVVNYYYKNKVNKLQESKKTVFDTIDVFNVTADVDLDFIVEARKKRDEDFLRAFYVMTNLDIITGSKLPPATGKLLKDKGIYNMNIKDIFKKIR